MIDHHARGWRFGQGQEANSVGGHRVATVAHYAATSSRSKSSWEQTSGGLLGSCSGHHQGRVRGCRRRRKRRGAKKILPLLRNGGRIIAHSLLQLLPVVVLLNAALKIDSRHVVSVNRLFHRARKEFKDMREGSESIHLSHTSFS